MRYSASLARHAAGGLPMRRRLVALAPLLVLAARAAALEPKDVCVVANKNLPDSRDVAAHYMRLRAVPAENLILLDLPFTEDITRADYDARLASPLRQQLRERKLRPKVLLTIYGVPLRVGPQLVTPDE